MNLIYFFFGIIFFQLVHVLMNYILFKQREFLYFIFSCLSFTAFCVFKIFPNLNPFASLPGEEIFSSLYGFVMIGLGMYYRFIRCFMDLSIYYPKLDKALIVADRIVISFGILLFLLGALTLQHISFQMFRVVYFITMPFNLAFIIYLGTRKKTLHTIVLLGTLTAMLVVRATFLQYLFFNKQILPLWNYQIIVFAITLVMLFLNFGLLYKSRMVQLENIQMEVQKQLELSQQRAVISADLHDDLGASLSSIQLNAIMVQKSLANDVPKASISLSKMVNDLKVVMENMGDIIWAIHADGHVQKSIIAQIKDFYFELLDVHNIQCHYHIEEKIEAQITDINARKNLLLIIKEAVNNILKHGKSTRIDITLKTQNDQLLLEVKDNGIGVVNIELNSLGNGLRNMKYRTEKLKGLYTIQSLPGIGTTITCLIPLTNIRYCAPLAI